MCSKNILERTKVNVNYVKNEILSYLPVTTTSLEIFITQIY